MKYIYEIVELPPLLLHFFALFYRLVKIKNPCKCGIYKSLRLSAF